MRGKEIERSTTLAAARLFSRAARRCQIAIQRTKLALTTPMKREGFADERGVWKDHAGHDDSSHAAADAFMTFVCSDYQPPRISVATPDLSWVV